MSLDWFPCSHEPVECYSLRLSLPANLISEQSAKEGCCSLLGLPEEKIRFIKPERYHQTIIYGVSPEDRERISKTLLDLKIDDVMVDPTPYVPEWNSKIVMLHFTSEKCMDLAKSLEPIKTVAEPRLSYKPHVTIGMVRD